MTGHLLLVIGIAVTFYAALPALGAFLSRGRWRRFRKTVTSASRFPTASPGVVGRQRSAPAGQFRFFGTLEAIQGDDRIWITNGRFSVAADLRRVRVYLVPETAGNDADPHSGRAAADASLGSVPWSRIFSLPEGTPVFVGGALFTEEGRGVFRDTRDTRLLVVIHDCSKESLVLRAISAGRKRNEYMNPLTLPSVAIGSLSLVLLAFSLLALPERVVTLAALTAGLAPLAPFLPPGFPLYFAYRSSWKKARLLRVQRDVLRLPLRYFPAPPNAAETRRTVQLPDGEPYIMIRGAEEEGSPGAILSGGARLALPPGVTRVDVRLPRASRRRLRGTAGERVAFCGCSGEGDGMQLRTPDDPMAGSVVLPGDPEALSRESGRAAVAGELVSAAFLALDVAVNIPLIFILLSLVIR
jgi:hypothetical protein